MKSGEAPKLICYKCLRSIDEKESFTYDSQCENCYLGVWCGPLESRRIIGEVKPPVPSAYRRPQQPQSRAKGGDIIMGINRRLKRKHRSLED